VNKRTSYEIAIAKKTEQCPVPDIADAIWSSIKNQLDKHSEDPDKDGNKEAQSGSQREFISFRNLLYFFAATIVVITIIIVALLLFNKEEGPSKNTPAPPKNIPQSSPQKQDGRYSDSATIKRSKPPYSPSIKNSTVSIDSILMIGDAEKNLPIINVPGSDSVLNQVLTPPDSLSKLPVIKKPHGVKGITNDDYKIISSKKDSVKQKN
jgi:hypothetical protein